jgi:diaminopimelate decarboxylase
MTEEGLGLDVAGGGEIITALKAGANAELLVLHGNAKTDAEIALAVEHRIGLVVVDNSDDVDRLEATVPPGRRQDVLVRVIPRVTADTHASVLTGHAGSKFGLAPATAAELIKRIEHSPRLRMRGLHVHVGSQISTPTVRRIGACGGSPGPSTKCMTSAVDSALRYTYADHPRPCGVSRCRWLRAAGRTCRLGGTTDHRTRSQHGGRRLALPLYRVVTVQARTPSRSSRSMVGWATTSRWPLFGQRFEAGAPGQTASMQGRGARHRWWAGTAKAVTCSSTGAVAGIPARR